MFERGDWLISGAERLKSFLFCKRFLRSSQGARAPRVATRRVAMCTEYGRVARMGGAISAPAVGLVIVLN